VSFVPGYRFAHPGYGCDIALRHGKERSNEAIQFFLLLWIASLRSQ
jgi:hypothetical protein